MGRKFNGGDLNAIKDLSAALARMSEDEVVGLGADDVPRIGVWATGANEVGVCAALECSLPVCHECLLTHKLVPCCSIRRRHQSVQARFSDLPSKSGLALCDVPSCRSHEQRKSSRGQ